MILYVGIYIVFWALHSEEREAAAAVAHCCSPQSLEMFTKSMPFYMQFFINNSSLFMVIAKCYGRTQRNHLREHNTKCRASSPSGQRVVIPVGNRWPGPRWWTMILMILMIANSIGALNVIPITTCTVYRSSQQRKALAGATIVVQRSAMTCE